MGRPHRCSPDQGRHARLTADRREIERRCKNRRREFLLPSTFCLKACRAATSTRESLSPIATGNRSTNTRSRCLRGGDRLRTSGLGPLVTRSGKGPGVPADQHTACWRSTPAATPVRERRRTGRSPIGLCTRGLCAREARGREDWSASQLCSDEGVASSSSDARMARQAPIRPTFFTRIS